MNQRPGFTLLELIVAAALMSALILVSLRMIHAVADHERSAERREIALAAVQAVAEQTANLPWDQLTTESAQQIKLPPSLEKRLPGAKLAVSVAEESKPLSNKRIKVELTWNNTNGQPAAPARLTVWAFPNAKPQ